MNYPRYARCSPKLVDIKRNKENDSYIREITINGDQLQDDLDIGINK